MNDRVSTSDLNPFATRFTRPDAARFFHPGSDSAAQLIRRLVVTGYRGAIRGPHGVGKSTLLADLIRRFVPAGQPTQRIAAATCLLDPPEPASLVNGPIKLVAIDGFEQWPRRLRRKWCRWSRDPRNGLLVTCHMRSRLPTLIRLKPHREVFRTVARRLVENRRRQCHRLVTAWHERWNDAALDRLLRHQRGNFREALFTLYDDWEDSRVE